MWSCFRERKIPIKIAMVLFPTNGQNKLHRPDINMNGLCHSTKWNISKLVTQPKIVDIFPRTSKIKKNGFDVYILNYSLDINMNGLSQTVKGNRSRINILILHIPLITS